jgi:acyl-coenzyme A thioesterase PaaI-like protein
MSARPLPNPPPGFEHLFPEDNFERLNGPFYRRMASDGSATYGFHSDARHGNSNGVIHGGALVLFLDHMMGHYLASVVQCPTATIGLDSRFIAGVSPGPWIEGSVTIRRRARTLAFVDGEASADGKLLATASGIFRVFEK